MRPRLIAALLIAALLISAGAAAAAPKPGKGWTKFTDTDGHWAQQQIAKMYGAGVLKGVGDGLFDPDGGMTRAQVSAMICRALGLHTDMEYEASEGDPLFADWADVPEWARPNVRACYEHRLMLGEITSKGKVFNPNKPITRQEFVVLLLRAVDLEDPEDLEALAQSLMGNRSELTFKDAKAIADWAVGYVLVALQQEWIAGYTNNTFQPNKPVTRAEAATLIERLEGSIGGNWQGRHDGIVLSVAADGSALTIIEEDDEEQPQQVTYTLAADCKVYLDGVLTTIAALESGWPVRVYVQDDLAVYITCQSVVETVEGIISELDGDEVTLVLTLDGGGTCTVLVTADTSITIDDEGDSAFEDLAVGMAATAVGKSEGGQLNADTLTATTPAIP